MNHILSLKTASPMMILAILAVVAAFFTYSITQEKPRISRRYL